MTDEPGPLDLIDTHAHLASSKFADDLDGVIESARQAGVTQMVAIATDRADSPAVLAVADRYPGVFAAVGIHPNETADAANDDWAEVERLALHARVVALGETGLDRYWTRAPFALQQDYFGRHLRLGRALGKPVVIHSRDCQADVIEQLQRFGGPIAGVQHSFTGTWDEAVALLDLGLCISFAGMITFENKNLDGLREVASRIPIDRLLVETDSPYLTPHPFRGKRNEPARVALTAETLAHLKGVSLQELAIATSANARRLFRLPRPAEHVAK